MKTYEVTGRYDFIENFDPRVVGYAAAKGATFRYVPSVGDAVLLQKQDNGFSTDWQLIAGGGSTPTGDPNQFAGFDSAGNLYTIPGWFQNPQFSAIRGAAIQNFLFDDDAGGAFKAMNFENEIAPQITTSNYSFAGLAIDNHFDRTGLGNDFNNLIAAQTTSLTHEGTGTVASMFGMNMNMGVNNGGTTNLFYGENIGIGTANGGQIDTAFLFTGSLNGSIRDANGMNIGITSPAGQQARGINVEINGTYTQNVQNMNMVNHADALTFGGVQSDNTGNMTNQIMLASFSNSGSAGQGFRGIGIFNSGNITQEILGMSINNSGNSGQQIAGINIFLQGTAPSVKGLQIDVGTATATASQRTVLEANGGIASIFNNESPPSNIGFAVGAVQGVYQLQNTLPIVNTTILGASLPTLISSQADVSDGPLAQAVAAVGFVGAISLNAGVTVESFSLAFSGAQINVDSTGGTVGRIAGYDFLGLIPGGGALNVTDLYGFRMRDALADIATNVWGLSIEDNLAENYMAKSLFIGTSVTKKVTAPEITLETALGGVFKPGGGMRVRTRELSNDLDAITVEDFYIYTFNTAPISLQMPAGVEGQVMVIFNASSTGDTVTLLPDGADTVMSPVVAVGDARIYVYAVGFWTVVN